MNLHRLGGSHPSETWRLPGFTLSPFGMIGSLQDRAWQKLLPTDQYLTNDIESVIREPIGPESP